MKSRGPGTGIALRLQFTCPLDWFFITASSNATERNNIKLVPQIAMATVQTLRTMVFRCCGLQCDTFDRGRCAQVCNDGSQRRFHSVMGSSVQLWWAGTGSNRRHWPQILDDM